MALNQLQTKAESDLDPVPSIDEIAHLRIITKAGESRKATPTQAANLLAPLLAPQLAPLLGIDYSKLTEQIVPGVFLPDFNGVKRQAYVRTFKGTTSSSASVGYNGTTLMQTPYGQAWVVAGYIKNPPYIGLPCATDYWGTNTPNASGTWSTYATTKDGGNTYNTILAIHGAAISNQPFVITLMYIK